MLGSLIKGVVKREAKVMGANKLLGRGKKALSNRKQNVEQRRETARNMMSGRETGGGALAVQPSASIVSVGQPSKSSAEGSAAGGNLIIQDISLAVSEIAQIMQGSLVLKEKAQRKNKIAAEKEKRAAKEAATEKPKKKEGGESKLNFKVPGVGLLQGIFGFITKFIYGVVILKLIEFAPQLKKLLGVFKIASGLFNIITGVAGGLFDLLATFVDFGYKVADAAEKLVGKLFGEEGAKKFKTFMENVKNLINGFIIWKTIGQKIFKSVVKNLKNAFKLVKGFIKRSAKLVTKLFPQVGKFFSKGASIFSKGFGGMRALAGQGAGRIGGFASKIFGKAAGIVSPALKGALPAVKGFSKRIPVLGPIIVGIVSLMSGEPAAQALFKAGGAALGGALGTFIPIPILGTLIGETIGVFVGDLLYELIMGGGMEAVGQKLKDTFKTFIEPIFNFFKEGIGRFFSNFPTIDIPSGFGAQTALGKLFPFLADSKGLVTTFPDPSLLIPGIGTLKLIKHMGASFFPNIFGDKKEESSTATISNNQNNKNGKNATEVAKETTYESGEGSAVIIPVPIPETKQVAIKNKRGRTVGYKTVVIDDSELALYAGK